MRKKEKKNNIDSFPSSFHPFDMPCSLGIIHGFQALSVMPRDMVVAGAGNAARKRSRSNDR
jgi:hypothetical protein